MLPGSSTVKNRLCKRKECPIIRTRVADSMIIVIPGLTARHVVPYHRNCRDVVQIGNGQQTIKTPAQLTARRNDNSRFRRYLLVYTGQILALLLLTGMVALLRPQSAMSFLVGGLIHFIAALCFAFSVFHHSGIVSSQVFVRSFYRGELVKFFLTALGFILAFSVLDALIVPALFAGFVLMMVMHTFALACVGN